MKRRCAFGVYGQTSKCLEDPRGAFVLSLSVRTEVKKFLNGTNLWPVLINASIWVNYNNSPAFRRYQFKAFIISAGVFVVCPNRYPCSVKLHLSTSMIPICWVNESIMHTSMNAKATHVLAHSMSGPMCSRLSMTRYMYMHVHAHLSQDIWQTAQIPASLQTWCKNEHRANKTSSRAMRKDQDRESRLESACWSQKADLHRTVAAGKFSASKAYTRMGSWL